jgi:glycosyltransferase involved in cell wall biosynthesis
MPTSWYQAVSVILDKVIEERPESILDIGVGFGKYGVMLREAFDIPYYRYAKESWFVRIDGVEAFESYKNPIHDYVYDNIYYQPIEECIDSLGKYDVILMIDILEHFDKETGKALLQKIVSHANKAVIISTPVKPSVQGEYLGNIFETHRSKWFVKDFQQFDIHFSLLDIYDNQALIVKIYPNELVPQKNETLLSLDGYLCDNIQPIGNIELKEKLHVAYVLPHKYITGGMKMLLEQIKWLRSRGHIVVAYLKGSADNQSAIPDWSDAKADKDVVIPYEHSYSQYIRDYDVIVAGWQGQIPELMHCNSPVMYWEQGHEPFFGDFTRVSTMNRNASKMLYSLPVYFTAVSDFVADILLNRYGRKTVVIPNGVDTDVFYPGNHAYNNTILLVGNPTYPFKNFRAAVTALNILWRRGCRFKVNWVCQLAPSFSGIEFPLNIILNPPQNKIPEHYRDADIFLFTSMYEGFGMPPLEAMASGLPTVCTDCGGVNMYIRPGENALLVDGGDVQAIANALSFLLENENARKVLSENARKTALEFSLNHSLSALENVLYHIKKGANKEQA